MRNYFHFSKGQRRGIAVFLLIVAATVLFKWIL